MIVLHAHWSGGKLHLWGETTPLVAAGSAVTREAGFHTATLLRDELAVAVEGLIGTDVGVLGRAEAPIELMLPTRSEVPIPSPALAHASGHDAHDDDGNMRAVTLRSWRVESITIAPTDAFQILERLEEAFGSLDLEDGTTGHSMAAGDSLLFFAAGARFARSLLAEQKVVPTLLQENGHGMRAQWQPWLSDESSSQKLFLLAGAMPPIARAVMDSFQHQAGPIVEDYLNSLVDAAARRALVRETMIDAIDGRDPAVDAQVAWLSGLLGDGDTVTVDDSRKNTVLKTVRRWIGGLEDRGGGGDWRLCLKLNEPMFLGTLADLDAPGDDIVWSLTFHLQALENHSVMVDAEDVWALRSDSASVGGRRIDNPQDLLLKELARASRVYRTLEKALADSSPISIDLDTRKAYEFLREVRPLLIEQGIGIEVPEWWDSPAARIGARLKLDAEPLENMAGAGGSPSSAAKASLGLQALVGYEWRIAVGNNPLTLVEFQKLAQSRAPLVRIDGRWVEVRPEDVRAAVDFIKQNPGGEMPLADALRLAYRTDPAKTGVPILGLDATGWVATMLDATSAPDGTSKGSPMPILETPRGFHGELRPYQSRGLSWLAFLDSIGLGPCLADDMGLGKTIQLLALLVNERERYADLKAADPDAAIEAVGPTLLVVPMSIVSNWKREATRFAPGLRVMVHHGVERLTGELFLHETLKSDLVITTYALAHRDRAMIELVPWYRVVVDEAQNIKNPAAKQSQAIRQLPVTRRIALTGTPLENRLAELWSIIDFCNPGYLGTLGDFRSYFAVPVERYHDKERAKRLRALVRPFILRRLKTDPTVISDLPPKLETKEYCRLTSEQASLYESCVKEMLTKVESAEGIRRRGLVLTALIRLKQICNHPQQLPVDEAAVPTDLGSPNPARSGKCIRLLELLDEVIAAGDQALVFTQFRQMAVLLATMLRQALDREVLLLHGGTPQGQRQNLIDRFQREGKAAPVLVLSLKAGGVGLNLTAASHVFHFDRWWNPAVENQATDRAFRIGQTKTVNVHKFLVSGTLEERIDQMIESKIALAEDVIGSGEDWLTELTTSQLRDILTLRPEAIGDE